MAIALPLALGIDAPQKAFPEIIERSLDAGNFDDIDADRDPSRLFRVELWDIDQRIRPITFNSR